MKNYVVAVPYADMSLARYLGYSKFGDKRFVYCANLQATDENTAIKRAEDIFWSDKNLQPFDAKNANNKKNVLMIDRHNIFVRMEDR